MSAAETAGVAAGEAASTKTASVPTTAAVASTAVLRPHGDG
jgi:hypothetical protein